MGKCPYITPKKPNYLIAGIRDGKINIGYNQCGKKEFCGFYPIYGLEEFFADYSVIDTICNTSDINKSPHIPESVRNLMQ